MLDFIFKRPDFELNRNAPSSSSSFKERKFNSSQQDVDYDRTICQFPSPNHDTHSTTYLSLNDKEMTNESLKANRFQFNGGINPTSPIQFNKSYNMSDIDVRIFNPHSSSSSFDTGSPIVDDIQVPSLKDIYNSYTEFVSQRKPPPIKTEDFFQYIRFELPSPESIYISKIPNSIYYTAFNQLKSAVHDDIRNREREISQMEGRLEQMPSIILETFNQLSTEDRAHLVSSFQQCTDFYRLEQTLFINQKILAIEQLIPRKDFISAVHTLQELSQSVKQTKDVRLEKLAQYEAIQEQLQKKKQLQESQDFSFKNKYFLLKTCLSFTVTEIKRNQGKIKLADYLIKHDPYTPKNMIEPHCKIAAAYRCKDIEKEIKEISKIFSYVKKVGMGLSVTVIGPKVRFEVLFKLSAAYPWCKMMAETKVFIGNQREIESDITEFCEKMPFTRRPILLLCQTIANRYLGTQ